MHFPSVSHRHQPQPSELQRHVCPELWGLSPSACMTPAAVATPAPRSDANGALGAQGPSGVAARLFWSCHAAAAVAAKTPPPKHGRHGLRSSSGRVVSPSGPNSGVAVATMGEGISSSAFASTGSSSSIVVDPALSSSSGSGSSVDGPSYRRVIHHVSLLAAALHEVEAESRAKEWQSNLRAASVFWT